MIIDKQQARSSLGKNTDFMVCKMPKMSKNRQKPSEFQAFIDFFHFHGMQGVQKKVELRL